MSRSTRPPSPVTTLDGASAAGAGAGAAVAVAPVRLVASGPRHSLRAVKVVWRREMIRLSRDRGRLIAGLAQPLLLLFVLGGGLSGLVSAGTGGVAFTTFLFPGVVATSTLFTAIFAGVSIVWDREFGFLREMLVAPVPRTAILLGKCLGGATVATAQARDHAGARRSGRRPVRAGDDRRDGRAALPDRDDDHGVRPDDVRADPDASRASCRWFSWC